MCSPAAVFRLSATSCRMQLISAQKEGVAYRVAKSAKAVTSYGAYTWACQGTINHLHDLNSILEALYSMTEDLWV
ncbi:hypothetical protein RB213_001626 [Colletotrichum asianum]